MKQDNYKKIKAGDRIRVVSWPRRFDGADAYAGTEGVVAEVDYDERFEYHQIGWISINTDNGATLCGVGLNRLKFEILS